MTAHVNASFNQGDKHSTSNEAHIGYRLVVLIHSTYSSSLQSEL